MKDHTKRDSPWLAWGSLASMASFHPVLLVHHLVDSRWQRSVGRVLFADENELIVRTRAGEVRVIPRGGYRKGRVLPALFADATDRNGGDFVWITTDGVKQRGVVSAVVGEQVIVETLDGLVTLHERGVVHADDEEAMASAN